jgi:hypothetical protein
MEDSRQQEKENQETNFLLTARCRSLIVHSFVFYLLALWQRFSFFILLENL